jgi:hypothetical protein
LLIRFHKTDLHREYIARIVQRLRLAASDREAFVALVKRGCEFLGVRDTENKVSLVQRGDFFSREMLDALLCGGEPYRTGPAEHIWRCMLGAELVLDVSIPSHNLFVTHKLILPVLIAHVSADTLENVFYPPSNLCSRYKDAIVAIDVELVDGTRSRGTGFVVRVGQKPMLVTCKHNVEAAKVIDVKTAAGRQLQVGTPTISNHFDVASWKLDTQHPEPLLRLHDGDVDIFDDVFTFGYPRVPGAASDLVAHRGEVNGFAETYLDGVSPALLISNLVSPGSSGCPVLNKSGFCVGMVFRWLEGEYPFQKSAAKFSAALPARVLFDSLV